MRFARASGGSGSTGRDGSLPSVMRPIPLALLAYCMVWWGVQLFMGAVMSGSPEISDYDYRLFGSVRLSHVWLTVHCGWMVLLLLECRSAWNSPPGVRKGHLAGGLLGVVLAFALCWWALRFAKLVS